MNCKLRRRAVLLVLLLGAPAAGEAAEENRRELIHLSWAKARDLLGCTWGDLLFECRGESLDADRIEEVWGKESLTFLHDLCLHGVEDQARPWNDCATTWLPAGTGEAESLVLLVGEKLSAAYRLRGQGDSAVLEEYRPLYAPGDLRPGAYRARRQERRTRSTDPQDIRSYRSLYPASSELQKRLGIVWRRSGPREVEEALRRRGFSPEKIERLVALQGWYLPQWKELAAEQRSKPESPGVEFRLFRNRDATRIKAALFRDQKLGLVFEYSSDGVAEYLRDPERRVSFETEPPWSTGYKKWGERPMRFPRALLTGHYDARILADPREFFSTRGEAFGDWRRRFETSRATVGDDLSWTDASGKKYFLLVEPEREWTRRKGQAVPWDVLEFEDNRLLAVYSYDEMWFENEVRPVKFQTDFWNLPADPGSGFFVPFLQARFTQGGLATFLLLLAGIYGLAWLLLAKTLGRIAKIPAVERRLKALAGWLVVRVFRRGTERADSGPGE
ncbi:MAG TPA: hypothetical protein VEW48_03840 [Thermoanaerobaculia bacterium]|nr:hypothetical protein [Thermoanaerobaculia bacterium]